MSCDDKLRQALNFLYQNGVITKDANFKIDREFLESVSALCAEDHPRLKGVIDDWLSKHAGNPNVSVSDIADSRPFPRGFEIGKKGSLENLPLGERKKVWDMLTDDEKDQYGLQIPGIIEDRNKRLLGLKARPAESGVAIKDAIERLKQYVQAEAVTKEAGAQIAATISQLNSYLPKTMGQTDRYNILMQATEALALQENETMRRQIGDHGIRHIKGDIEMAVQLADEVLGGQLSDDAKAKLYLTGIFHDVAYLTEPGRTFMDRSHERHAAMHLENELGDTLDRAFGKGSSAWMSNLIATHAATSLDWFENTPPGSPERESQVAVTAFRLADNLALFHKQKLPPVFAYVPGNVEVLTQLGDKVMRLDRAQKEAEDKATDLIEPGKVEQAKKDARVSTKREKQRLMMAARQELKQNIAASSLPAKIKNELMVAANEVTPDTPKFTYGMLAGDIREMHVRRNGDDAPPAVEVLVDRQEDQRKWLAVLHLNQRPFQKLAETYAAQFQPAPPPNIELRDQKDNVLFKLIAQ